MTTFLAILVSLVVVAGVIAALLVRRGGGDGMIERQQREALAMFKPGPPPRMGGDARPDNLPSDEAAMLAVPEINAALTRGRKIEAIKLLRERTGMGLKEAKQLVDRLNAR